jgi:hypothetical protein
MKLTVVVIAEYHYYQSQKSYPTFFSQGYLRAERILVEISMWILAQQIYYWRYILLSPDAGKKLDINEITIRWELKPVTPIKTQRDCTTSTLKIQDDFLQTQQNKYVIYLVDPFRFRFVLKVIMHKTVDGLLHIPHFDRFLLNLKHCNFKDAITTTVLL